MHGDCHLSPFKLVLACHDAKYTKAFVCTYESKYGIWEDSISTATTYVISRNRPSLLVGNTLCWLLHGGGILEFDFERLTLGVIEKPASVDVTNTYGVDWSFQIIRGEDNGLGLAVLPKPELSIQLWARKSDCDGVASWVLQKTVQLDELFTRPLRSGAVKLVLMPGYDEDTNVIFLSSVSHDFMLQLESMQFKYIGRREYMSSRFYYPYTNFYTAGRGIAGGDGGTENVNA